MAHVSQLPQPVTPAQAEAYRKRGELLRKAQSLGFMDLLVAVKAIEASLPTVSAFAERERSAAASALARALEDVNYKIQDFVEHL